MNKAQIISLDDIPEFEVVLTDLTWPNKFCIHRQKHCVECSNYPKASFETIQKLGSQIKNWMDDNAVLFLWCSGPSLEQGIKTFEKLGFRYSTVGFTLVHSIQQIKPNPPIIQILPVCYPEKPHTKATVDFCLFGRKGKSLRCWPNSNRISQIVIDESKSDSGNQICKPDDFYEAIETMYPTRNKLEIFARKPRIGWYHVLEQYSIDTENQ